MVKADIDGVIARRYRLPLDAAPGSSMAYTGHNVMAKDLDALNGFLLDNYLGPVEADVLARVRSDDREVLRVWR